MDELRAVLSTCRSSSRHNYRVIRDEAILRMFATTGLRLAELTNLRMGDIEISGPYSHVTVLGKGRKVRSVPLDDATRSALSTYLTRERPRSAFSQTHDAVWLASKGPMTHSGIAQMVMDRGRRVGVALHPHALRHAAIHAMLGAGMSEGDTMAVSGHSSRSMMDRYGAAQRGTAGGRGVPCGPEGGTVMSSEARNIPVGIGMGKPERFETHRPHVTSWCDELGWHASITSGMTSVVVVGPYPDRVRAVQALRVQLRSSRGRG